MLVNIQSAGLYNYSSTSTSFSYRCEGHQFLLITFLSIIQTTSISKATVSICFDCFLLLSVNFACCAQNLFASPPLVLCFTFAQDSLYLGINYKTNEAHTQYYHSQSTSSKYSFFAAHCLLLKVTITTCFFQHNFTPHSSPFYQQF